MDVWEQFKDKVSGFGKAKRQPEPDSLDIPAGLSVWGKAKRQTETVSLEIPAGLSVLEKKHVTKAINTRLYLADGFVDFPCKIDVTIIFTESGGELAIHWVNFPAFESCCQDDLNEDYKKRLYQRARSGKNLTLWRVCPDGFYFTLGSEPLNDSNVLKFHRNFL